jgi:eukaryotic-like serine/threonine-protein kinase
VGTTISLRDLFEAAIALPAAERGLFLDRAGLDAERRASIERMLSVREGDSLDLLERSVADVASRLGPREPALSAEDWAGREIGGYRLVSKLGEGGSSVVFLGEREQEGVRHQVAVKVLRRMLLGASETLRFRRERRALAQLSHPGIARYLDGGVTDTGVAYIVLERIEGRTITEYARHERLDVKRRVELMMSVCRAVDAAHRALIVHRDLKPSNMLVTADGQVKLLDFGIAKFLDTSEEATETQHRALTPAYAAPEQFAGGAITTATDVFALGVILAELLTGQRPESRDTKAPSTRVGDDTTQAGLPEGGPAVRRQLRGDLDNVVLKAVSRDAEKRYPSAEALASDLERYLRNEPVLAHPPTWAYVVGKFVLRNRVATAAVAIAVLGLSLGLTAALVQAQRAREEAARAQSTRDFLVSVFRSAEPAGPQARKPTVAEVTETAIRQIQVSSTLAPDVRDDLLIELGAVLRCQGELETAERILRNALDQVATRPGAEHALRHKGLVEILETQFRAGRHDAARSTLSEIERSPSTPSSDMTARRLMIEAELHAYRQEEVAIERAERAILQCSTGCTPELRVETAKVLGVTLLALRRNEEAVAAYGSALALATQHYGHEHVEVAAILNGRGAALRRLGRLDEALRDSLEVVRIDEAALPVGHWRRAEHLNHLGNVHYARGNLAAALPVMQQALEISESVYGRDNANVAADVNNIGQVEARLGHYDQAVERLRDAVARIARSDGADAPWVGLYRCNLGYALGLAGDIAAGLAQCEAGTVLLERGGDAARSDLASALRKTGELHEWRGDPRRAIALYDRALAAGAALEGSSWDRERLEVIAGKACALLDSGGIRSARRQFRILDAETADAADSARARLKAMICRTELARRDGNAAQLEALEQQMIAAATRVPVVEPYLRRRMEAAKRPAAPVAPDRRVEQGEP